ncbi:glutamine synthetase family protein [Paenarthrobacter sp. YJN-5]|uniref:glutamine synthetase family protein n=1 Tax=Paenarthrobacter sp. YJN-5 TaxID=2735316 RepID=UPI00187761C7|nr:glutamine synthetase family protein [Paenarthrobacter sp. YJN-5]QOT19848.1 glutamine synthetase [Paenarthrobacter sp. YJN-5]QOT19851.1 glutamine synthetase [Paenarthrobacter sp. YJN-5]
MPNAEHGSEVRSPSQNGGRTPLTVETFKAEVEAGLIDIVEMVVVDMQGRLQGKRLAAQYFLESVLHGGSEAQSYLLATDVEMGGVEGYSIASWSTGYGNLVMQPDASTLRRMAWSPSAVSVLCDVFDQQGAPMSVSPRQLLRRQLDELAARGWTAVTGTEMEFQIFTNSYEEAWNTGYRNLQPVSSYSADYSLLDTRGIGPLLADLYRDLAGAKVDIESIVAEAAPGQHEVVLKCRDALTTADNHAFAKFAAKQIAATRGHSLTFMAKIDQNAGNACHIHFSLRAEDDSPVFAGDDTFGFSPVMRSFLAGQLAFLPELTLLLAPNINSYKRFVDGSYAPTAISWGHDNRTCALRVLGRGKSLRFEHRLPGADVNPYLAIAAIVAAGLRGIEDGLELQAPTTGNAYTKDLPHVPNNLRDALRLFRESETAAKAFGEDVVAHYARMAEHELQQFDQAITDWEKFRGFERL